MNIFYADIQLNYHFWVFNGRGGVIGLLVEHLPDYLSQVLS